MLLNAAAILAAKDKKTVVVPVPEWGQAGCGQEAQVLVGSMGAMDHARIGDWLLSLPEHETRSEDEESPSVVTCESPEGKPEPVPDAKQPDVAQRDASAPARQYTRLEQTELMIRYVAASILDPETHRPAFTHEQVTALGDKSLVALDRIYQAALELNGDTKAAAGELEKNSERTAAAGSGGA